MSYLYIYNFDVVIVCFCARAHLCVCVFVCLLHKRNKEFMWFFSSGLLLVLWDRRFTKTNNRNNFSGLYYFPDGAFYHQVYIGTLWQELLACYYHMAFKAQCLSRFYSRLFYTYYLIQLNYVWIETSIKTSFPLN